MGVSRSGVECLPWLDGLMDGWDGVGLGGCGVSGGVWGLLERGMACVNERGGPFSVFLKLDFKSRSFVRYIDCSLEVSFGEILVCKLVCLSTRFLVHRAFFYQTCS